MKKKIIIGAILLAVVIVALVIPKATYQKWFSPKDNLVNPPASESYSQVVYLKNKDGLLVGLKVPVQAIAEDQIAQKWALLTSDSNMIPTGYQSVIAKETELIDYSIDGNVLTLNVSNHITDSEGRLAVEALAWTFTDSTITDVVLKVDGQPIAKLGDYEFTKINRRLGINLNYETFFLYESTATTIIYEETNYTLPVTYFHLDEDICDYIITKIIDESILAVYDYQLSEEALVLNFVDKTILTVDCLQEITETVKNNMNVAKLVINDQETVVYEAVFYEISE